MLCVLLRFFVGRCPAVRFSLSTGLENIELRYPSLAVVSTLLLLHYTLWSNESISDLLVLSKTALGWSDLLMVAELVWEAAASPAPFSQSGGHGGAGKVTDSGIPAATLHPVILTAGGRDKPSDRPGPLFGPGTVVCRYQVCGGDH